MKTRKMQDRTVHMPHKYDMAYSIIQRIWKNMKKYDITRAEPGF